jgi:myo-inositol-1(or 4)-monophosphatase
VRLVNSTTDADILATAQRVAIEAAEAAGDLLRERALGDLGVRPKGGAGDVVTDLDIEAEQLIVGRIRAALPHHQIIAEESGVLGLDDDRWVWLVDPLDGTNNVAIGLSAYVVGIALCKDKVPVLGVVHDPVARRTWWAARGAGSYSSGGTRLCPRPRPTPYGLLLAWTQGHSVARDDNVARALKLVLETTSRRVLQLWAPLLSWVMLARGDIDGMVGYCAEAVDLPAGALIAVESGMAIRSLDGTGFDERIGLPQAERSFVAGRPEIIDELLEMVSAAEKAVPMLGDLWVPHLGNGRAGARFSE